MDLQKASILEKSRATDLLMERCPAIPNYQMQDRDHARNPMKSHYGKRSLHLHRLEFAVPPPSALLLIGVAYC